MDNSKGARTGKRRFILLGGLCVFLLLAAGLIWSNAESKERGGNGLCLSCHIMEQTVFQEFKKTKHFVNPSGVRAKCSSCHVPEEFIPMMQRKAASIHEVASWALGTIDTQEKFEANRLRMAKKVWADMKATDSRECKACHNVEAFDFAAFKKSESAKTMQKGLAEGQTCIDCHKGIAHTMPDLSAGFRMLYEKMDQQAKESGFKAAAVYPVRVTDCYLEKDGQKAGRLLPLTRLEVLEDSGDWAKVRVKGWQQIGAERVICAMQGRRIFSAALNKGALDAVTHGEPILDPDTELSWQPVQFEPWIKKGNFLADKSLLNTYGSELHAATCGGCHAQTPATHFSANQWIGGIKSMGTRVTLNKNDSRFLLKYLQLRASDVVGDNH